ncbi:MAG: hypothetical protein ABJL99_10040 [Aliishimia sp.]
MLTVGQRIIQRCSELGIKLKPACDLAGVEYPTLHQQIRKNRPIPFATIDKLAPVLQSPLELFSERRSSIMVTPFSSDPRVTKASKAANKHLKDAELKAIESGTEITTDAILDWLDREGGRLNNFEEFRDSVDLFFPAQEFDIIVRPAHLGKYSLATRFFDLKGPEDYQEKVSLFDPGTLSEMVATHVAVQQSSNYRVDDVNIVVTVNGKEISGRYRRVMAPVIDENDEPFTLVGARLIRAVLPLSNE